MGKTIFQYKFLVLQGVSTVIFLCSLLEEGIAEEITCPVLYYYDDFFNGCFRCHPSWAECLNSKQCTTCSDGYVISTYDIWVRCPTGIQPSIDCINPTCSDQCGEICSGLNTNECLSCPSDQYLNLETTTCVDTCPDGTTAIESGNFTVLYHPDENLKFCRPNYEYYVDSSSTSAIELGTRNYPFK